MRSNGSGDRLAIECLCLNTPGPTLVPVWGDSPVWPHRQAGLGLGAAAKNKAVVEGGVQANSKSLFELDGKAGRSVGPVSVMCTL